MLTAGSITLEQVTRPAADAPREEVLAFLADTARRIRLQDLALVHFAGAGHIGGDFSATDIVTTLYGAVLNVGPDRVGDPERDRFVLSKGHVAGMYYTALAAFGFIPVEQLRTFLAPESKLNGHPNRLYVAGVEANTGPLGHGLPIAVGLAKAAVITGSPRRTYVLVGDGELQEGSNWEAMMASAQHKLERLTVIVDRNRLQQGASTAETNDLDPLADKLAAFGLAVREIDGHDYGQLLDALSADPVPGKPTGIIAHTHKGHPISYMADNVAWHHKVPNAEQYAQAVTELGGDR